MSLGSLISAGASLIGGFLNRDAQEDANAAQQYQAERNMQLQKDFAQQGIRWKVDDARAAGVHPLYALGANTVSYSPVAVGGGADTSLGSAVASAGQDIGRSMDATRTASERGDAVVLTKLQLERAGLENDLLRTQIAKTRAQLGPPMPALSDNNAIPGQPATRLVNLPHGVELATPGNESTQDAISKEYGDEGLPQTPGQYRFVRDAIKSYENWVRAASALPYGGIRAAHDAIRYFKGPSNYERRTRNFMSHPTQRR